MDKFNSREDLIAALTEDVTPVKPVRPVQGAGLIIAASVAASIACIVIFGFWQGMINGEASPFFWISNGLLALVGASSTTALVASAMPRVGAQSSHHKWSLAMLSILPVAALIAFISFEAGHDHGAGMSDGSLLYWHCAAYGLAASGLVAITAIAFLRRGAPVSLTRASWLIGLTSGSLGALAYNITCPIDSLMHVGVWHVFPVFAAGIFWRYAAPPLIRW
ncbi:DUF1109 domain-containing protein [Erythrobacter sp. SCSIO 43205]|uniref:DUF1109 domain-containing protein n=1 Tax=Erythrobacter sp. SCSIO 43205 TaxID=2779361 RepID=UPI001CA98900|nr:DUF1109 domain-containing protein [Erythrobacter sp. SCSIO 43205]UAB78142.1 DUF1109 domain-containing protein [Erythrobacter sp. SCSIO 43205]